MLTYLEILTPNSPAVATLLERARNEPHRFEHLARCAVQAATPNIDQACAQAHLGVALTIRNGSGLHLLKAAHRKMGLLYKHEQQGATAMLLAMALAKCGDLSAFAYFAEAQMCFENARIFAAGRGDEDAHGAWRRAVRDVAQYQDKILAAV